MAQHLTKPGNSSEKPLLLSAAARDFLHRRIREFVGILLFIAAVAFSIALGSYEPSDPSFNNATSLPAQNWLGLPGAYVADLLLHSIGLVAMMLALILACWGWRVISHRGFRWFWVHLAIAPLAMLSATVFVAGLEPGESWPLAVGLGGAIGEILMSQLLTFISFAGLQSWAAFTVYFTAGLTTLFTLFALGITPGEWKAIIVSTYRICRRSAVAIAHGIQAFFHGITSLLRRFSRQKPVKKTKSRREEPTIVRRRTIDEDEDDIRPSAAERRVSQPTKTPKKKSRRAAAEEQPTLDLLSDDDYQLPPLHLLYNPKAGERKRVNEDALEQNARLLESVLDDYGVRGRIINVRPGPVVTLYELEPAPGTKASRVIGLADDIARSMSAVSVRVAVVPGRNAIGIELPNQSRETVFLRELLTTTDFDDKVAALNLALGKDIGGEPVFADLAKMPHLLIAGTTGSGKSVGINTMILSLLYRLSPEKCRLILIDPKMLELSVYDHIPHLLTPVVTDPGKAVVALKWAVREMENRYKAMASLGVRNITGYNQRLKEAKAKGEELTRSVQTGFDPETGEPIIEIQALDLEELPFIVVVVDEMADLMMVAGKDIEGAVQRLAQMARAAGIHVILATQRPSVDVITGTIKANFPTRISFQVTSKIDSRTILGEQGAEQLLGQGDMLYMAGGGRITRVHGPFVSDEEVEDVVKTLRKQGKPAYLSAVTEDMDDGGVDPSGGPAGSRDDALYDKAVDIVSINQKASTSFIQRHLKIGYNRAALLIEMMEEDGVIGPANHVGKREVFARNPNEDDI